MPPDFSLQPVLDFRHNCVEALEIELGQILNARQRAQDILDMLNMSQADLLNKLAMRQLGEVDLVSVGQLRVAQKAIEAQIAQKYAELVALTEKVTEQQRKVVVARQDEEALQTLKKKSIERFHSQQALQEQRLQDDIYISQAYHRRLGH